MSMFLIFGYFTASIYLFGAAAAQYDSYPRPLILSYDAFDSGSNVPNETIQPPPPPAPPPDTAPVPITPKPPSVTQPPKECITFCDTCRPQRSDEAKSSVNCILPAYYFEGICTVSTLQRCRSACMDQGYKTGKCVLSLHCSCSGECSVAGY